MMEQKFITAAKAPVITSWLKSDGRETTCLLLGNTCAQKWGLYQALAVAKQVVTIVRTDGWRAEFLSNN